MKNSFDKNEKVVQTKGGFSYLENEKKALDDYLVQLAAENKAKINTQANTTCIGFKNAQIKNESTVIKHNETVVINKLCNDNRNIIQEKPFNQKVEDIKINNTRVNNSFLPTTSSIIIETNNKNAIKPIIQADYKQQAPTIEKKEVPVQKLDRIDLLNKKFDMNINNSNTNQGNEKSKVTVNNSIKSNPVMIANNLVSSNTSTSVKKNSSSFVPNMSFVPSSSSKTPNLIATQANINNPIIATFPNQQVFTSIDRKNNNIYPLSNVDKSKEQSSLTLQEDKIKNYDKELMKGAILKKDPIKETQTLTTPVILKKIESVINTEIVTNKDKKAESSEPINKNESELKSGNSIKEIPIVPTLISFKLIESANKTNSVTNKEKAEEYSQPILGNEMKKNIFEVKANDANKILIESKPIQIQKKSIFVEDHRKIEENFQIPSTKIDKKIEKVEKSNININDIPKVTTSLNEEKESIILKPTQIPDNEKRQSMLQMMNRLDIKMAGTKIPEKIEAQENNVPIISSISGKLEMNKKIQEMTRHMTQEQESNNSSTVSSEVSIVSTISQSDILQVVQKPSTIPSVPKIPVGIPKVPKMPNLVSSIPPIPNIPLSIPPVPKTAGVPPVPAIPKIPLPVTKNSKPIQPNNCVSELSISEQIAKGVQLKKVDARDNKIEITSEPKTGEKRESKMNMFEEMKKLQLKKVNK